MKIRIVILGFFLFSTIVSFSQNRTISGYVTDKASGEALYLATVFDTVSKTGTVTNEYGFYSITLPQNDAVLRISYLGLNTVLSAVPIGKIELDIAMEGEEMQDVEGVEVSAESLRKSTEETNSGTLELSLDKVEKLPVFMGEKDVVKTLQLMPGVSSGGEGSSGLYVRGGGPDQNLILLDGVPVYNASHLFGFFSVFNNDALSKVTMIKGGFPARYGGRTSSVLDMRMKEGNLKKYNVEGSIGLISSKLLVEGPIKKDKTAFIVSARRTYADLLVKPFMANRDSKGGYYFYDLNAKIHHKINNKHHLYLSGYFGQDRAKFEDRYEYTDQDPINPTTYRSQSENGLDWGNAIGAFRWNYRIAPKLFMNTTATYSLYKFNVGGKDNFSTTDTSGTTSSDLSINYMSNIEDWSGKSDFTFIPNTRHYVKFGVSNVYHTFRPGVFSLKETGYGSSFQSTSETIQYANEASAYIENDHKITEWLKINYGLHFSMFFVKEKNYSQLQPRLSGNIVVSDNSSIKFSYARTAQFIHLLSNTGIGLPTDLWVPATENIGPIIADQVGIGYNQLFADQKYNLIVEGYYKTMDNLIQYKEGVSFIGNSTNWENKVEVGQGWSYGGEVFFEKRKGDLTGWVGYTLSWTERQFDNINGGEKFPFTYDRRHDLSIAATYDLNEKWDFGVVFVASTGRAVSLPTQQYGSAQNPILGNFYYTQVNYLSSINGYRMPAYHRLDIGANYHKTKKWGEAVWSFSIYNVYSRQNAFYLFVETDYNDNDKTKLKQIALFPIIPSVSWKFKLTHLDKKHDDKK